MTITLKLTADEETLLVSLCQSQSIETADYIHRVIRQDLETCLESSQRRGRNQATIALLQEWMDEKLPPAEGAVAVQGWEGSMKSLDEQRLSARLLFPPE